MLVYLLLLFFHTGLWFYWFGKCTQNKQNDFVDYIGAHAVLHKNQMQMINLIYEKRNPFPIHTFGHTHKKNTNIYALASSLCVCVLNAYAYAYSPAMQILK